MKFDFKILSSWQYAIKLATEYVSKTELVINYDYISKTSKQSLTKGFLQGLAQPFFFRNIIRVRLHNQIVAISEEYDDEDDDDDVTNVILCAM